MVSGASETLGFERFLKNLGNVEEVEVRPIEFLFPNMPPSYYMHSNGKKVAFTKNQLQVLRALFDDGRMPVSKIAQRTGFTARRVRRILRELIEGDGVSFLVGYNIFARGDMEYRLKIVYDMSQASGQEIITGIYNKHPDGFWWASTTTNEPLVDIGLIIDRPGSAVPIINEVKAASFTRSVEDYVSYPRVVQGSFPLRLHLAELLIEAGLLDPDNLLWGTRGTAKISQYLEKKQEIRI
jgi:DNA-binding Lrp family transcriptional regulator